MGRTRHETFTCAAGCTVEATLNLIGGKWKGVILYRLLTEEVLRFNELRRLLPSITQRMLTNLVQRTIYPEVPPRVEYRLTDEGQTLEPVISALKAWGDRYVANRAD